MCGNVSILCFGGGTAVAISTHTCAGNVSDYSGHYAGVCRCFNSYMRGECFRVVYTSSCTMSRFRFIYMWGMFSPAGDAPVAVGVVSIHICAGNVSPLVLWWFQLIYVRGMFPSASGIGRWSTRWFRLIYVRGECFNTGRGHQPMGISFNSYMCGEYFWRLVDVISNVKCVSTHICAGNVSFARSRYDSAHFKFQLIYARGMFQHLCVVLPF